MQRIWLLLAIVVVGVMNNMKELQLEILSASLRVEATIINHFHNKGVAAQDTANALKDLVEKGVIEISPKEPKEFTDRFITINAEKAAEFVAENEEPKKGKKKKDEEKLPE